MKHRLTADTVRQIQTLIDQGHSLDEVIDILDEIECDSRSMEDDYHRLFGDDYNDADDRSYHDKFISDRLDMGQNDAGEWLGFC